MLEVIGTISAFLIIFGFGFYCGYCYSEIKGDK